MKTTQQLKESNPKAYNQLKSNYGVRRHIARKEGYPDGSSENFLKLEFPEYCEILGRKINYDYDTPREIGGNDNSPSFDKIDPRLGYVEDNIRVVSFQGNQVLGNVLEHLATNKHFFNFMENEMKRIKKLSKELSAA